MKRLLLVFLIINIAIYGCNNVNEGKKSSNEITTSTNLDTASNSITEVFSTILGSFVGDFGTNKITVLITKATADSVSGRSIVGGNDRPFAGTILKEGDKYIVNAKEPGDDKEDGIFKFTIDPKMKEGFGGSWKPNKPTETVGEKFFYLNRKAYKYLKDAGTYPEASQRLLVAKDVENLLKYQLEFMRNEIFARHGYCFKKKDLRQQFELQDWYVPNTIDIKNRLSEIEKKNIAFIKGYEKYADEYGDDFGR
jgi:YARHG domain